MSGKRRESKVAMYALGSLLCSVVLLLLGFWLEPSGVAATPNTATEPPPPAPTADLDAGAPSATAPEMEPTTATIVFATTPPSTATVVWGRKLLGKITPAKPLVIVRPRDSGPLDVMVRAQGYLAVQTRAHTFSDNRVIVKLTPPENKSELFGYRAPLDAGVEPEQAAALDAVTPAPAPPPEPAAPFRVVPAQPAPSPWLVPP